MIHHATTAFWECYQQLPAAIQQLADKNYELMKADPEHPSLHFKKVGSYRSVRVGLAYRALGIVDEDAGFQVSARQRQGWLGLIAEAIAGSLHPNDLAAVP